MSMIGVRQEIFGALRYVAAEARHARSVATAIKEMAPQYTAEYVAGRNADADKLERIQANLQAALVELEK